MVYVQYSNHPELKTEPSQHSSGVSVVNMVLRLLYSFCNLRSYLLSLQFLFCYCYRHLKSLPLEETSTLHTQPMVNKQQLLQLLLKVLEKAT